MDRNEIAISNVSVQKRYDARVPTILTNRNQIVQVFVNLVKNAIDAMKGKGKIIIEILEEADTVKINVTDTGKGISKKQFNTIFEPGYTSKKRGWGLGLSLAKRIVEEFHNGKIKVLHSEVGKGTTMQISLKSLS